MLISMVYFGMHPKLLRNTCFAKKHKKSLKKMQATMPRPWVHVLRLPRLLWSPKRSSLRSQQAAAASSVDLPTWLIPSSRSVLVLTSPRVSDSADQSPMPRLKPRLRHLRLQLRLPKMPRPPPRFQSRDLLHLPVWGQKESCEPWAAVCMGLMPSCAICTNKSEIQKK